MDEGSGSLSPLRLRRLPALLPESLRDDIPEILFYAAVLAFGLGAWAWGQHQGRMRDEVAATALLAAARDWPAVLLEPYASDRGYWPVGISDHALARFERSITANRYRWRVDAKDDMFLYARGPSVASDFLAAVTVRDRGGKPGAGAGVVFALTRVGDLSAVLLADDRLVFFTQGGDEVREIAKLKAPTAGRDHRLTVVVQRGACSTYLDGKYIGVVETPARVRGAVGLLVSVSAEQRAAIDFDDFTVRALPAPPLSAASAWPTTFWDSFSFAGRSWRTDKWPLGSYGDLAVSGSRRIAGGELLWRVVASTARPSWLVPRLAASDDFLASVETRSIGAVGGSTIGLALWCRASEQVHFLELAADGRSRLGSAPRIAAGRPSFTAWRGERSTPRPRVTSMVVTREVASFFVDDAYAGHTAHRCVPPYRIALRMDIVRDGNHAVFAVDDFRLRERSRASPPQLGERR